MILFLLKCCFLSVGYDYKETLNSQQVKSISTVVVEPIVNNLG